MSAGLSTCCNKGARFPESKSEASLKTKEMGQLVPVIPKHNSTSHMKSSRFISEMTWLTSTDSRRRKEDKKLACTRPLFDSNSRYLHSWLQVDHMLALNYLLGNENTWKSSRRHLEWLCNILYEIHAAIYTLLITSSEDNPLPWQGRNLPLFFKPVFSKHFLKRRHQFKQTSYRTKQLTNVDLLNSIISLNWNTPPAYNIFGLFTNNLHTVSDSIWWLVITAWRKDYWALTAPTQLISDMMKGHSLNWSLNFSSSEKEKSQYGVI